MFEPDVKKIVPSLYQSEAGAAMGMDVSISVMKGVVDPDAVAVLSMTSVISRARSKTAVPNKYAKAHLLCSYPPLPPDFVTVVFLTVPRVGAFTFLTA